VALDAFLSVPDEPVVYRIDGAWPIGGRVVLAAPHKAGKSTLVANAMRAMVDGEPFLGEFACAQVAGTVVLIDDELDPRMLRRWLRDQRIANTGRVVVLPLRGHLAAFDLLDPETRGGWAGRLRDLGAQVVILDCLRPVLDALGLSEDRDAGKFLVAFDALLSESGAAEGLIAHHMGHSAQRSRGDSRILDWPDALWILAREHPESGGQPDPNADRYFSAYGRDVDIPESRLEFDSFRRRVTVIGGSRKHARTDALLTELLGHMARNPARSQRQLEAAMAHLGLRGEIRSALRRGIETGQIDVVAGPKGAHLHSLSMTAPSAPEVRQRTDEVCASAPLGRTRAHTQELEVLPAAHTADGSGHAQPDPELRSRYFHQTRGDQR
jgi:hypothetical protein